MSTTTILGYRKKPTAIYILAGLYLLVPFFTAVHLLPSFEYSLKPVLTSTSFIHDLVTACSAAVAVVCVTRWSLLYFAMLSLYILGVKFLRIQSLGGGTAWFEGSMAVFWTASTMLIMSTTLRVPYLNPQARWWKRGPRFHQVSQGILYYRGVKFPIVMMNISGGGMFVKLDERIFQEPMKDEQEQRKAHERQHILTPEEVLIARKSIHNYPNLLNETVHISLKTLPGLDNPFKGADCEVDARIVWRTNITDPYRYGLGLKFYGQSLKLRLKIRKYVQLLRAYSGAHTHAGLTHLHAHPHPAPKHN